MAHAKVVGVGVLIEKMSSGGRAFLSGYSVPVESLAKVDVADPSTARATLVVVEEKAWESGAKEKASHEENAKPVARKRVQDSNDVITDEPDIDDIDDEGVVAIGDDEDFDEYDLIEDEFKRSVSIWRVGSKRCTQHHSIRGTLLQAAFQLPLACGLRSTVSTIASKRRLPAIPRSPKAIKKKCVTKVPKVYPSITSMAVVTSCELTLMTCNEYTIPPSSLVIFSLYATCLPSVRMLHAAACAIETACDRRLVRCSDRFSLLISYIKQYAQHSRCSPTQIFEASGTKVSVFFLSVDVGGPRDRSRLDQCCSCHISSCCGTAARLHGSDTAQGVSGVAASVRAARAHRRAGSITRAEHDSGAPRMIEMLTKKRRAPPLRGVWRAPAREGCRTGAGGGGEREGGGGREGGERVEARGRDEKAARCANAKRAT
eukprot:IDg6846t1